MRAARPAVRLNNQAAATVLAIAAIASYFLWLSVCIGDAKYHRIAEMPAEVEYMITDNTHGRTYYTADYTLDGPHNVTATCYWLYDFRKHWSFVPVQLTLIDVDAQIDQLIKIK